MNAYQRAFPGRHAVLPVIHVETEEQALRNTRVAREAGADGVFLINHGLSVRKLLDIHGSVADAHPDWWIGVNCLGLSPDEAFQVVSEKVAGVWTDSAKIDERQDQQSYAESVFTIRKARAPECLYFGGVAFKYQRSVEDLEAACRAAARYMDVVTTSGPGTGREANIEKIRRMKLALGDAPLAIASGVTPENVETYLPYADAFLVATGISRSFSELDPAKARDLVDRVRALSQ